MVESGGGMVRLGYVRRAGTSQPLSTAGGKLVVGRQSSVVSRRWGAGPTTVDRRPSNLVVSRSSIVGGDRRPTTIDRRPSIDRRLPPATCLPFVVYRRHFDKDARSGRR